MLEVVREITFHSIAYPTQHGFCNSYSCMSSTVRKYGGVVAPRQMRRRTAGRPDAGRFVRPRAIVRSIPLKAAEVKSTHLYCGVDATTYLPNISWHTTIPETTSALATWLSVDTSPAQGSTASTRVGNRYKRESYHFEGVFGSMMPCQARFVIFEWKPSTNPDTSFSEWLTPVGTPGRPFNPFFEAHDDTNYRILYQKFLDFSAPRGAGEPDHQPAGINAITALGYDNIAPAAVYVATQKFIRVKKDITCRKVIKMANDDTAPAYSTGASVQAPVDTEQYSGRIYWCLVSNARTVTNEALSFAGHWNTRFTDD